MDHQTNSGNYSSLKRIDPLLYCDVWSQVHRVEWWMALYDGPTPKRHFAYSNSSAIRSLDLGRLVGWSKHVKAQEEQGVSRVKTVKKYHDKHGRERYKGDSGLRASESGTYLVQNAIDDFQTMKWH